MQVISPVHKLYPVAITTPAGCDGALAGRSGETCVHFLNDHMNIS